MSALTPKQESFAQSVASGMTQTDAYRAAYSAEKMKPETIRKRASELMGNGVITGRVEELRKPITEKAQITLKGHLDDLLRLRNMAAKDGKFQAAISAEVARGRAAGLYVEKGRDDADKPEPKQIVFTVVDASA